MRSNCARSLMYCCVCEPSGALSFSTLRVRVGSGAGAHNLNHQPVVRIRVRHEQADRRQHRRHVQRRLPCALRQAVLDCVRWERGD
eukprot:scaffold51036_cov65-Phaeocystis_antarctica.AAC.6